MNALAARDPWPRRFVLAVALALLACMMPAWAHDTPTETRLHAFVRADGDRLHVLLRMPLAMLMNAGLPKQGPGYIALNHVDEGIARAVRSIDAEMRWSEDGRPLTLADSTSRISLPSDTSFGSYESARALIHGPRLPETSYVFWNQGYLDMHLEYHISSARGSFAIDFRVAPALRDRVRLDLRYGLPGGGERAYEIATAQGPVLLDPRWHQAAWSFAVAGFEHILEGGDHLLFLLCMVLPFRRVDMHLVGVVSAFTVAHSVTLIAAAYGLAPAGAWFGPAVETLIAASILWMALENVLQPALRRRWLASAGIGLVHGFGFSFMLQAQLQFAGSNLLVSLLAFNVGVEAGQLLVVTLVLVVMAGLRAWRPAGEQALVIVVCALAGHTAWHWLLERGTELQAAVEPGSGWVLQAFASVAVIGVLSWAATLGMAAVRRRPSKLPGDHIGP